MKNNILLFHIGTHKTGTTSLQRFLYDNNEILKKYNWSYPCLDTAGYTIWTNGRKLPWDEGSTERWKMIEKELQDFNVIISDEEFWYYPDKLSKILSKAQEFNNNIKVIVYLRRQDRLIESMYNQDTKTLSEHGSIIDYMNNRLGLSNNYLENLEKISDKIGHENIIVRIYEKEQFAGKRKDIFSDFIHSLPDSNINPDWDTFTIPERQNLSLNGNFYEIKKICNSIIDNPSEIWNKEQIRGLRQISGMKHTKNSHGLSNGYFSKQERKNLLNSQAENNAEIARKYLNRENGELFYDKFLDYPVFQNQATDFERDMIQTLFSLIYRQQKKIEILPAITAIFLLKKNKKLALWGIGKNGEKLLNYPLFPDIMIDNDPNKYHKMINNIPVVPSNEIKNWEEYFIVVTPQFSEKIDEILCNKGLKNGENYLLFSDYLDEFIMY